MQKILTDYPQPSDADCDEVRAIIMKLIEIREYLDVNTVEANRDAQSTRIS